jgi:hypothetical protein
MFNHDPVPPANPPLPDRALDQLQVVEARHVLLYVAQEAQGLRTALGAMFAHTDQQRLVTSEKVQRGVQALIDDLESLREKLGGPRETTEPPYRVHFALSADGMALSLCGREIKRYMMLTSYPVQVTCLLCARILRARERNEQ